jgi:hypothetical protein
MSLIIIFPENNVRCNLCALERDHKEEAQSNFKVDKILLHKVSVLNWLVHNSNLRALIQVSNDLCSIKL